MQKAPAGVCCAAQICLCGRAALYWDGERGLWGAGRGSERWKSKMTKGRFTKFYGWAQNNADIIQLVFSFIQLIAVVCAALTLYYSVNPQNRPGNTNWTEMANAGDTESQLKLAEFNYDIGEFSESAYWYKVLLTSDCKEKEYKCIAYNNLGWLYAHGYGLSSDATTAKDRLNYALTLFQNSAVLAESHDNIKTARWNEYILLITFGSDIFDYYEMKRANAEEKLSYYCVGGEMNIVPERKIKTQELIFTNDVMQTGWIDSNTYIVLACYVPYTQVDEETSIGPYRNYMKTIYEEGTEELPELKFISLPTEIEVSNESAANANNSENVQTD